MRRRPTHSPAGPASGSASSASTARAAWASVYVARDEELGREVALKEIRPDKVAVADLRGRFVLEAEINGGLEHPGIVPVYSLGTYDDGRPFYAMRFVEGDSLKEAIESYHQEHPRPDPTAVEFRKLLGRFIDVCEAIAFAHSKGVLHRDLKPHNVMLGRFGETLLIDWGLAKATGRREPAGPDAAREATLVPPSGSGHAPTLGVLGSPPYMSPEQAAGRGGVARAGDGRLRAGGDPLRALDRRAARGGPVDRGDPRPGPAGRDPVAAVAQPERPAALEAVCLKALATDPRDRYPSALDLANDVQQLVVRSPNQRLSRTDHPAVRRFLKRHRTLATSAVAALLVASITLSIAYSRESAINTRLAHNNDELRKAKNHLEQMNRDLEKARELAEKRFERTLQFAQMRYLDLDTKEVLDRDDLKPVVDSVLQACLRDFQEFSKEVGASPTPSARDLDAPRRREARPGRSAAALGHAEDARKLYAEAIASLEMLPHSYEGLRRPQADAAPRRAISSGERSNSRKKPWPNFYICMKHLILIIYSTSWRDATAGLRCSKSNLRTTERPSRSIDRRWPSGRDGRRPIPTTGTRMSRSSRWPTGTSAVPSVPSAMRGGVPGVTAGDRPVRAARSGASRRSEISVRSRRFSRRARDRTPGCEGAGRGGRGAPPGDRHRGETGRGALRVPSFAGVELPGARVGPQ